VHPEQRGRFLESEKLFKALRDFLRIVLLRPLHNFLRIPMRFAVSKVWRGHEEESCGEGAGFSDSIEKT
jgi:hypothetical protein